MRLTLKALSARIDEQEARIRVLEARVKEHERFLPDYLNTRARAYQVKPE